MGIAQDSRLLDFRRKSGSPAETSGSTAIDTDARRVQNARKDVAPSGGPCWEMPRQIDDGRTLNRSPGKAGRPAGRRTRLDRPPAGGPVSGPTGTGTVSGGHPHHHHHHGGHGGAGVGAGVGGAGLLGLIATIIKLGLIGLITIIGVGLGVGVVGGALVFTGKPSPCVNRTVVPSTAASQALREQWDTFESQAASGNATIAFDETGVTSRGVEYIDEKDLPLEDLQVHFCPDGLGEASGTIKVPGPDIHVLLRGTLDLSGAKPRIDVREIKARNLPGLFGGTDWVITNIVKKSNADILDFKPHLTSIQIGDGSATLTGGP